MRKDPTEFRKRFAKWKAGENPYKNGRISDEEYVRTMEKVAADNWLKWGEDSEDAALTRILNDNTYDYRGYYSKYPNSAANADTHWSDEFKTVWHPTFSLESTYSGKKSQFNPYGYPGGTWQGELFNPLWYQQHLGIGFYKDGYPKLPKFEGGEEKFKLKKTPEFVQAGKDNSWSKVTNDDMGEVFQSVVARPNRTGGNTSAGSWKKLWDPKYEKPLEIISPEFDVISGARGIINTLPKKLSADITFNEAKKLSDDLWDNLYGAAIKSKDAAKIQNLRDLHFKVKTPKNKAIDASGNPIKQYHTVGDEYDPNFNTFKKDIEGFDSNIYTTDNKYMSGTYSSHLLSKDELEHIIESTRKMELSSLQRYYDPKPDYIKKLISIYSNPKNARKQILKDHKWLNGQIESNRQKQLYSYLKNPVILDAEGRDWAHLPINNLPDDVFKNIKIDTRGGIGDWYSTRSVEAAINNLDYDGAIIKNVLDYGGSKRYFGPEIMNSPGTVFSIKSPKAVKLADPITYDDAGKIIPLSLRDNFNIADLRYGVVPTLIGGSAYQMYK